MNKSIKKSFKKRKVAVLLLCFIWMFSLSESVLQAQTSGDVIWNYPVVPGMEAWNVLQTEDERIAALQVPEEIPPIDDIYRMTDNYINSKK